MLEKLSNVLKKTTDKIANAVFLDKNLVDTIVKDLQRALIEADVNVSLVKELSEKIKKAAIDERIKGIEKKEHITKLLHDELIKILGRKREVILGEKNTFMFVGLYGAGKCVHGNSNVQLSNGEIINARELYERFSKVIHEEDLEDGKIIDVSNEEIIVPSFNPQTLEIEDKRITHLWKLEKEDLIEVKLDNGNDSAIKVTPEHPFFVLRNGNVGQVRADEINESDYIAVPGEVKMEGKTQSLFEDIRDLDLFVYVPPEDARDIVLSKYKTLQEACENLGFKKNYCKFTSGIKKGKIPIEFLDGGDYNILSVKGKLDSKIITFPAYLNSELSEFLGYVIGDGHIDKNCVEISSEDSQIISRLEELSKILFNISPRVKKDERTRRMYKVQLISATLVKIMRIFGLNPGKKGKNLKVPKQILISHDDIVRSFLRAYFDCDSYPAKNRRCVEVTSESGELIRQVNLLLRRFGILSTLSKKYVNEIPYWRLTINAKYAEIYSDRIGYSIKEKKEKVNDYRDIGEIQGAGKQDMIPLGKVLEALRLQLGFSIGEIQKNAVYSYGRYEKTGLISKGSLKKLLEYYLSKKNGIFLKLFQDISRGIELRSKYSKGMINGVLKHLNESELICCADGQILLSKKGQEYLEFIRENEAYANLLLKKLEYLVNSKICWIGVNEISRIENDEGFVYDLTVEDNHSFVANGIVVHNTTTIGKVAAYYAKRGHKVCAVGLDVHRPAAPEQLKQICDQLNVPCFIDSNEKDALKIWKKYEKEIKKYNLVLVDTAGRDALDVGLITEIKEVAKAVKASETFLVIQADIGQTAKKQAQAFKEATDVSGVIITKMDSSAKAGGALTACAEVDAPVVFIGTGEKMADLETFDPESFLSRLLGMGDLNALMEKIHSVMDKRDIERQQQKLQDGKFTLRDLANQLDTMGDLGSMDKIMGMIPGMGKLKDKIPEGQMESQQERVKRWKHIIKSMTEEEIENPEVLEKQTSRIQRIAHGSGSTTSEVRALIKQWKMLNEMMKSQSAMSEGKLDQKTMMKMARKFGKKMKF